MQKTHTSQVYFHNSIGTQAENIEKTMRLLKPTAPSTAPVIYGTFIAHSHELVLTNKKTAIYSKQKEYIYIYIYKCPERSN